MSRLATISRMLLELAGPGVPQSNTPRNRGPRTTAPFALSALGARASLGIEVQGEGMSLGINPGSEAAGALLEVVFDAPGTTNVEGWQLLVPGSTVSRPDGRPFHAFWVRVADVGLEAVAETVRFDLDPEQYGQTIRHTGRFPAVSLGGAARSLMRALNLAGTELSLRASDEGALAVAGWTGAAYVRAGASAAGRWLVNLIAGQDGVTGGAGAVAANTPRVTLASDDPAVAALALTKDVGDAAATTLRTVGSTVPTAAASQATATTPSAIVVAANARRKSVTIKNRDTAENAVLNAGAAAVVATHFRLPPGASITIESRQAIHAIRGAAADVTLDVWEESY